MSPTPHLRAFATLVIPYVDKLYQSRFSGEGVAVVVAMSINPVALPKGMTPHLLWEGRNQAVSCVLWPKQKLSFINVQVPPVVWRSAYYRALLHEKQAFMSSKNLTKSPTFQLPAIQHQMHTVVFFQKCSS